MSITENCVLRMAHIMRISIWRRKKKKAKEDEEEEKCQENRSSGCHKCFLGPSEKQNLNTTVSPDKFFIRKSAECDFCILPLISVF